jgi:hypothetical protein
MLRCNKTPHASFAAAWSQSYRLLKQNRLVARRAARPSLHLSDQSLVAESRQIGVVALTPP